MKTEVISITPAVAETMLAHNYESNRKLRKSYVNQLAAVMKDGRFISENGQTIVIGEESGILYDGQHRLHAIIESGTTQTLLVVYVKDGEQAYTTIDNGTKRGVADFIEGQYKSVRSAAARIMACVEWGHAPLLSCLHGKMGTSEVIDRGLVLAYQKQHESELFEASRDGARIRDSIKCGSPTIYAVFICLVRYCGADDYLDEFIQGLLDLASVNATIAATKMQITGKALRNKLSNSGIDSKWLLGTLLDSYSHFCSMDNSTTFNQKNARIEAYAKLVQQRRDALSQKEAN